MLVRFGSLASLTALVLLLATTSNPRGALSESGAGTGAGSLDGVADGPNTVAGDPVVGSVAGAAVGQKRLEAAAGAVESASPTAAPVEAVCDGDDYGCGTDGHSPTTVAALESAPVADPAQAVPPDPDTPQGRGRGAGLVHLAGAELVPEAQPHDAVPPQAPMSPGASAQQQVLQPPTPSPSSVPYERVAEGAGPGHAPPSGAAAVPRSTSEGAEGALCDHVQRQTMGAAESAMSTETATNMSEVRGSPEPPEPPTGPPQAHPAPQAPPEAPSGPAQQQAPPASPQPRTQATGVGQGQPAPQPAGAQAQPEPLQPPAQPQPQQPHVTSPTPSPAPHPDLRKPRSHTTIPKPDEFLSMPAPDLTASLLVGEAATVMTVGPGAAQLGMAGLSGEDVFSDAFSPISADPDGRLLLGDAGVGLDSGAEAPAGVGAAAAAAALDLEDEEEEGRKINLAAASDGASVVAANKEAKRPDRLIDGDDDSYMKNACSASKWVIVELSQLGRVDEVRLTMKEMYSSRVREFLVKGRQSHPKKDGLPDYGRGLDSEGWQLLGSFVAENRKGSQAFRLPRKARVRYLLLQVLSHYGSEEMCALNSMEVRGVTAAQELEAALSRPLGAPPPPPSAAAAAAAAAARAAAAAAAQRAPAAGQGPGAQQQQQLSSAAGTATQAGQEQGLNTQPAQASGGTLPAQQATPLPHVGPHVPASAPAGASAAVPAPPVFPPPGSAPVPTPAAAAASAAAGQEAGQRQQPQPEQQHQQQHHQQQPTCGDPVDTTPSGPAASAAEGQAEPGSQPTGAVDAALPQEGGPYNNASGKPVPARTCVGDEASIGACSALSQAALKGEASGPPGTKGPDALPSAQPGGARMDFDVPVPGYTNAPGGYVSPDSPEAARRSVQDAAAARTDGSEAQGSSPGQPAGPAHAQACNAARLAAPVSEEGTTCAASAASTQSPSSPGAAPASTAEGQPQPVNEEAAAGGPTCALEGAATGNASAANEAATHEDAAAGDDTPQPVADGPAAPAGSKDTCPAAVAPASESGTSSVATPPPQEGVDAGMQTREGEARSSDPPARAAAPSTGVAGVQRAGEPAAGTPAAGAGAVGGDTVPLATSPPTVIPPDSASGASSVPAAPVCGNGGPARPPTAPEPAAASPSPTGSGGNGAGSAAQQQQQQQQQPGASPAPTASGSSDAGSAAGTSSSPTHPASPPPPVASTAPRTAGATLPQPSPPDTLPPNPTPAPAPTPPHNPTPTPTPAAPPVSPHSAGPATATATTPAATTSPATATAPAVAIPVPAPAPSLDSSLLSVLDGGSASKPRLAGNLFDVIKQEMMMLKLNQTRLWAYIAALVDALNARHVELEADAQAVEDKIAMLDASIAAVTSEAVARATEASLAPLAALEERLAALERRAGNAEAIAAAVLLYSSAVLGAAAAAGLVGSRWRALWWLAALLSVANGAVGLLLSNRALLMQGALVGYGKVAAGKATRLLAQAAGDVLRWRS